MVLDATPNNVDNLSAVVGGCCVVLRSDFIFQIN